MATDSTFSSGIIKNDSSLVDTFRVVSGLTGGTKYFWRVRGGNTGGWGPYSSFRRFSVLMAGIADGLGAPTTYALYQNFPNPFNPTTVVSFQLPVTGNVRLVVCDLLGREVAVLVNERKEPGRYEVRFDAGGLSSGVVLYRITAGDFVQTYRMLLLR